MTFLEDQKGLFHNLKTHFRMAVKRADDYWNIDGSTDLSDSWTSFTQFTLLDEKPPDGYMWSGVRHSKRQPKSRPDHLWPELWTKLGRNAKQREKQKWAIEKPKFDNAEKKETPMAPAMPCETCKKSNNGETRSKTNDFKSKFACILEASESTRMRMEESLPKYHQKQIRGDR